MLLLPQLCQTADPWILAQAEQVPVVKVAVYILFVDRGNSGVPDAKPVQQVTGGGGKGRNRRGPPANPPAGKALFLSFHFLPHWRAHAQMIVFH